MLKQRIAILGSTGSIGVNALRVVRARTDQFRVVTLAAHSNIELLEMQAREFRPRLLCVFDHGKAMLLQKRVKRLGIPVVTGDEGLILAATHREVQRALFAVVGAKGLEPLFAAIRAGKDVAIANKEPLVIAGELIRKLVRKHKVRLLPVDSEHSAIWQCLEGRAQKELRRIIITASGGPFLHWPKARLAHATVAQALKHPKWRMGKKITIDSATLMNKGLEVIEASHLFGVSVERIDVLIHPESIIHSFIEFVDGSMLAQLAITDMKLPIQYALSYPERLANNFPRLDLAQAEQCTFFEPDTRRFPCLTLAYEAKRIGGTMPTVLNAANEIAVSRFLNGQLRFAQIPVVIERVMKRHASVSQLSVPAVLKADAWAREEARRIV